MKFRHSILGDMKTKGNSFSEESGRGQDLLGKCYSSGGRKLEFLEMSL